MTDKQLEEAAWDYVAIEIFGDMGRPEDDYAIYIQAFKAGAAYQLQRMRCGKCRHLATTSEGYSVHRCVKDGGLVGYTDLDFGCIHFEAKED